MARTQDRRGLSHGGHHLRRRPVGTRKNVRVFLAWVATHQMVEIVRQYGITQVIRTEMPATADEQHFFVEACDQLGVRLLVVANLPERWGRPLTFIDDDGVRFIGLREESLENPFNQVHQTRP